VDADNVTMDGISTVTTWRTMEIAVSTNCWWCSRGQIQRFRSVTHIAQNN